MPVDKAKHRASDILWRTNNPEKRHASDAAYCASHREEAKARAKAWRVNNAEKYRATNAAWYVAHTGRVKTNVAVWKKANPEKHQASQQRRRARERGAKVVDFTNAQWVVMQEAYDHRCVYCGKRAKGKLTKDHLTPLSKGGAHTLANIVPACRSCNSRKGRGEVLIPVQPLLLL